MKDLVRSKLVPRIRQELVKLAPALITEHGKDLQHAPGVDPSKGFTPATVHPQTAKKEAAPKTTTTTTTSAKVAVNTTTVTASDEMRTTAEELFITFTDPQRIAAFTRGPPRQFEGAHVGGKFSIFDGNVVGEFVKLDKPSLIVQKWRLAQWAEGHFSTQESHFDQNDVDGVTQLRVTWSGVPVGQEDVTKQNWEMYYVRSLKQTFGYVQPFSPFFFPLSSSYSPILPTFLTSYRGRSPCFLSSWKPLLISFAVVSLGVGLALSSDRFTSPWKP